MSQFSPRADKAHESGESVTPRTAIALSTPCSRCGSRHAERYGTGTAGRLVFDYKCADCQRSVDTDQVVDHARKHNRRVLADGGTTTDSGSIDTPGVPDHELAGADPADYPDELPSIFDRARRTDLWVRVEGATIEVVRYHNGVWQSRHRNNDGEIVNKTIELDALALRKRAQRPREVCTIIRPQQTAIEFPDDDVDPYSVES
jgi:hypothetical protein